MSKSLGFNIIASFPDGFSAVVDFAVNEKIALIAQHAWEIFHYITGASRVEISVQEGIDAVTYMKYDVLAQSEYGVRFEDLDLQSKLDVVQYCLEEEGKL